MEDREEKTATTLLRFAQCTAILSSFICGMIMEHLEYVGAGFFVAVMLALFIE